jgi:hypothetical protein
MPVGTFQDRSLQRRRRCAVTSYNPSHSRSVDLDGDASLVELCSGKQRRRIPCGRVTVFCERCDFVAIGRPFGFADVHFGPAPALQSATSSSRDPPGCEAARLPHMQQQPVDCYHYINIISTVLRSHQPLYPVCAGATTIDWPGSSFSLERTEPSTFTCRSLLERARG